MSVSRRVVTFFFVASALGVSTLASAGSDPATGWNEWYLRGEVARAAGNLPEASLAFARARAAAPGNPIPTRAACEVARLREEQGDATISSREPCNSAMVQGGLAEDFANEVASVTAPLRHPSLDDLALATLTADAATRVAPDQPWGALGECALGRRLGSAEVVASCLDRIGRFAPSSASREALSFASFRTSPAVWVFRALVVLGFLGTFAHAFANRRRRGRRRRDAETANARAAILVLTIVLGVFGGVREGVARAEPSAQKHDLSDFKIDDANPEASVPTLDEQNKHPLEFGYFLQDLAARYEKAAGVEDHEAVVRYLRALTKAAPTAFAPRKLCEELERTGDLVTATKACRTAITRSGATAGDFIRFVHVALSQPGSLPKLEQDELNTQIDHLASQVKAEGEVARLRCDVAVRFHDIAALETCSGALAKLAPNDPASISYQWALALEKHDAGGATSLVRRARELGMSADGITRMETATREMSRRRVLRFVMAGVALVLLALGARAGARFVVNRRRVSPST